VAGIFSRFIFNNAIFNTDFVEQALDIIHGPNNKHHADWRTEYENEKYRAAKRKEKLKQEEIIRLRLEAQANLVQQRELKDAKDKQSLRQMAALEREAAQLQMDIQKSIAILLELQRQSVVHKNNLAFLVLSMATPFGGLRMQ